VVQNKGMNQLQYINIPGYYLDCSLDKGKGQVLDTALLHDEHMLRSALQSRKWQLIGMS